MAAMTLLVFVVTTSTGVERQDEPMQYSTERQDSLGYTVMLAA